MKTEITYAWMSLSFTEQVVVIFLCVGIFGIIASLTYFSRKEHLSFVKGTIAGALFTALLLGIMNVNGHTTIKMFRIGDVTANQRIVVFEKDKCTWALQTEQAQNIQQSLIEEGYLAEKRFDPVKD
jgi:hypothetical protein